ncbi:hypothetical protein OAN83_00515 [Alphaproteobacteria bacterium]|nr:hypothetical protein [Alphaproteobacteria bacterium]
MKLQSLVDPRIGKFWQERHRYAGSVISKAASSEDVEGLISADINGLVNRYAAWLMTNLTEAGFAAKDRYFGNVRHTHERASQHTRSSATSLKNGRATRQ